MLVDFAELKPILYHNRTNHAWIINLPVGFGFDEALDFIPPRQVIGVKPTVHQGQTTEIINIDDIREVLSIASISRDKRLFIIIHQAEKMNETAANALLKSLEEPATNTVFIFLTENQPKLLPTIRSRAHILRVKPSDPSNTWRFADPKYRVPDPMRCQIDLIAHGSLALTRALSKTQRQMDGVTKKITMANVLLGTDNYEKMKTIIKIKKSTKTRILTDEVCRLCIEISLKNLEADLGNNLNRLTFEAKCDIIRRCSAFETVLTRLSSSNNFNAPLLLASECVS